MQLNSCFSRARRRAGGFTIVEVALAASVMVFAIATSLTTLGQAFRAIDTARSTTIAAQVLQSVMEDLRLQTWAQIDTLASAANNGAAGNVAIDSSFTGYDPKAAALLAHFTITRTISDVGGQTGLKQIVLLAKWTGVDGRSHTATYSSLYGQNGLYDYYHS